MRVLVWHVHGSWTTSFVQGDHAYLLPVVPDRGPDGRGRAETWDWPERASEVAAEQLHDVDFDVVVLQRPHEIELVREWTGRTPGRDVPAVYVEHNTPGGDVPFTRHPLADQEDIPILHVTHFNRLFWDCGTARTDVIEHGIVDPGHRYTGDWCRAAVVVNDPVRRGRAVGTDLIAMLARTVPVDVFGLKVEGLDRELRTAPEAMWTFDGLSQDMMHRELARRRVYVHTPRWTSLGLSLIEAMHLGMPVVSLATTETPAAVPPDAGVLTNRPEEMARAVWRLVHDTDEAHALGVAAREAALARYGLGRFLADWDLRLQEAAGVELSGRALR